MFHYLYVFHHFQFYSQNFHAIYLNFLVSIFLGLGISITVGSSLSSNPTVLSTFFVANI